MTWLLCYDIEDDKLRLKIARMLEKDGWERLQKSVFAAGKNTPEFGIFFDMVKRKIAPLLTETDKIYAWKLSDAEFENAAFLGAAYDARWIQGGYTTMYVGDEILLK